MTVKLFKHAAVGVLALGAVMTSPAQAQFVDWAFWASNPRTVTDKTFTLIDFDGSVTIQGTPQNPLGYRTNTTGPDFGAASLGVGGTQNSTLAFTPGQVNIFVNSSGDHQVNLTGPNGAEFPISGANGSIYAIQYIVNIDTSTYPPTDPGELAFGTVRLSLNVTSPFGEYLVSKRVQGLTPGAATGNANPWNRDSTQDLGVIFDATLTTIDATPATIFCGTCTRFLVTDYVTVTNSTINTVLNQITNTFEQVPVPVPAPLALLAVGLLGLGASRRLMKRG